MSRATSESSERLACYDGPQDGILQGAGKSSTSPGDDDSSEASAGSLLPSLPPEVIRHHLAPHLAPAALRALRLASRAAATDVAACAITSIRRPPGTHPLPPDLGARFPRLTRLDLSGDSHLTGGLGLFRALQSVGSSLVSLSLEACSGLPASFIARQLPEACTRLQHLSMSCNCAAAPDTEASLLASLAAAPLASSLTSLELHCGPSFQPELRHLGADDSAAAAGTDAVGADANGLGRRLRRLRVVSSRELSDEAVAALPSLAPALEELSLSEVQSRRGRHVRGDGLAALSGLTGLRSLTLCCREPDPRVMAAALARLTQLTELDLSRCHFELVGALAPLAALLQRNGAASGGGGNRVGLRRLLLPKAWEPTQLERGVLPALSGAGREGGDGVGAGGNGGLAAGDAVSLEALRLHAAAELPAELAAAVATGLRGLRELDLSCSSLPGLPPEAATAAATALAGLTSLRLQVQSDGAILSHGNDDHNAVPRNEAPALTSWYQVLPAWTALRRLVLTDFGLNDRHLHDMGCRLSALTHLHITNTCHDVTGEGFASWRHHCRQLTSVTLYECEAVTDTAVVHLAALPLRSLTLAHLPCVGADGVRHLAAMCTTLRSVALERLAGVPGAALAALWRLPLLEALSLRMCEVNNTTLEMAVGDAASAAAPPLPSGASCSDGADGGPQPASPSPVLSWLELQGTLVSTAGLRCLRHMRSLTHLDVSNSASVGDGVGELLLYGGGGGGGVTPPVQAVPLADASRQGQVAACAAGGSSSGGNGAGRKGGMLLPSLVHVDLSGCPVAAPTLDRLRAAGLAVNVGASAWR